VRHELASILWRCERQEEALTEYRSLARALPNNLTIQYELGYTLRSSGFCHEALEVLERALAIESRAEIHVELARCYRAMNRTGDAEASLKRALAHSPGYADALLEQLRMAAESRQWASAIDAGSQLMSSHPTAEAAYIVGVGLSQLGRSDDAEVMLRRGLNLEPDNVDLVAQLGIVLADQGNLSEAKKHVSGAIARRPGDYHLLVAASHVFSTTGDTTQALQFAQKATDLNANVPETHFSLGLAYLELSRSDEALSAFKRALELAPGLPHAEAGLAASLAALGRYSESRAAFAALLTRDPQLFSRPLGAAFRPFHEQAVSKP
jgi:tetratricopeptide (TPR) repeat protein